MGITSPFTGERGLYPAQQYVADVAGELLPSGRYRYPIVFVTVMRQSGKTVLGRMSQIARAATYGGQRVRYTAQTGKIARFRWKENVEAVKGSPLRRFAHVRYGAGDSAITFPNDSTIAPFAPTSTSVHSETLHRVDIDEIWALSTEAGDELVAAIKPAQLTLPNRQLWLYSAANRHPQHDSPFMRAWMLIGRAAVANPDAGIAYFEWSVPEGLDSYDPAVWRKYHPGIGYLCEEQDIADAITTFTSRADFDRAYLNRWPVDTGRSPIDVAAWRNRVDPELTVPEPGRLVLAYDVAPDRSEAAIVASWRDVAGRPCVSVIEHAADATWLLERVPFYVGKHRPTVIAADGRGEVRSVTDRLRLAGVDVHELTTADYTTACGSFLLDVMAGGLAHDGSEPFEVAVKGAVPKPLGEAWIWDARQSDGVTPLRAGTVARWVVDHPPAKPAPVPKAKVRFAGDRR